MKYFLILLFIIPGSIFSQSYITNKDYNEFVTYVRDSLLRKTMGEEIDEEAYLISVDKNQNIINPPSINWKTKLNINWPESREALEPHYFHKKERLNKKREFDTRKFIHNGVMVYPDELDWCRYTRYNKSWAIFLSKYYFTHPYFQSYPVQGLSQEQVQEYIKWKYPRKKKTIDASGNRKIELKLPKEKLQFTIGDYFKFYKYTQDSISIRLLGEEIDEEKYLIPANKYWEEVDPPMVNMKAKIKWNDPVVVKTLKHYKILTPDGKIDNRLMTYEFYWFGYYHAANLSDPSKRASSIFRESQNLIVDQYLQETSSLDLKKELKNKEEINYSYLEPGQLKAFYYWSKYKYPTKDVFDGFIPHESDIELIRKGKITDKFYNFNITIPTIVVK